jgi:hypothetical protein
LVEPISIIGHDIHEDSNTTWSISLIQNLLYIAAIEFPGSFLDRALNIVLGQRNCFGIEDRRAQSDVAVRVAPTEFRSNNDRLGKLAPQFATSAVDECLSMLDVCPLRMSCHVDAP